MSDRRQQLIAEGGLPYDDPVIVVAFKMGAKLQMVDPDEMPVFWGWKDRGREFAPPDSKKYLYRIKPKD